MNLTYLKFYVFFLVVIFGKYSYTQELDSLIHAVDKTIDRKERVDLFNTISRKYTFVNHDSSMMFAEKAYKEAVSADYSEGEINTLIQKCNYYLCIGDNKLALELIKQAEGLSERIGDKSLLAYSYMIHGDIFAKTMLIDQAFEYYTNAMDIFNIKKDYKKKFMCINRIGVLQATLEKYDEAMELFQTALDGFSSMNYKNEVISTLNNIALVNSSQGNHEKSLDYFKRTLELNKDNKNQSLEATVLGNMALQYVELGDTITALEFFDKSLKMCDQVGNVFVKYRNLFYKCVLLYQKKQHDSIEPDLLEILEISEKSDWFDLAMESTHLLSLIYRDQGNYLQAYNFFKQFYEYYKIFESEGNTTKFAELQFRYDFEKEALKMEHKHKRRTLIMITGLIISLLGIILISILFLHLKTRASKIILQKNNLKLEKDKLKLEQQNLTKKLELRNKEITSNVLLLQKKNDVITTIANKLLQAKFNYSQNDRLFIEKCIDELRDNADDSDWKNFEVQFNQIYESFYRKLDEINPDLTVNDRRLCAYLRLKMSTKEIASLTNSTSRSVEVARYRLRKKLNLTDQSVSLNSFLERL